MKASLILFFCLAWGAALAAQENAGSPRLKAPIMAGEKFLLLPEPRAARSDISLVVGQARLTAFTPVKQVPGASRVLPYTEAEFTKLGISKDTFYKKAALAADKQLALLTPELMRDKFNRVIYAVYRGEDPVYSCLLIAPSLAKTFEIFFGKEVWVTTPDRNSLYIFPPNSAILEDFAADLEERFESNPFSASEEIFSIKVETGEIKAVGSFTGR